MGLLQRIATGVGDIAKGFVNSIPGVGGITEGIFGAVGDQGFVGTIDVENLVSGRGGGLTQAAGGTQGSFGTHLSQLTQQAIASQQGVPQIPTQTFSPTQAPFSNGTTQPVTQPQTTMANGQIAGLLGSNQIVMEPQQKIINSAPPGWVIVTMPDGSKKAVLKEIAKCLGLWKPRKKPPISASDWSKLKRANAVKKKAKRIAETADFVCRKSKR